MASFYEDASLVVIPSGYKTSKIYAEKPTSGAGDLTFTRASGATRVASNGLIEKVRTNLILQSNTFSNASWGNIGSSETSGQAGYDGTNNAWSLVEDSSTGTHTLVQVPSTFGLVTLSVYAKAGTRNWVFLRGVQSSSNVRAWFNLSTGAIGTVEANGTAKIESVGNGWYRCSLSIANFESGFEAYVGISSADNTPTYTGNGTGNILIQNFQYEAGDIATAYIPTTTAAVSVGPVSNVPRLDYLGSTCPRLNLEPQRTNLWTNSESFSGGSESIVTYTANSSDTLDPAGYNGADKFAVTTSGGDAHTRITRSLAVQAFTVSLYVKGAAGQKVQLFLARDGFTEIKTAPNYTLNGSWQRLTFSDTFSATSSTVVLGIEFGWTSSDSVAGQLYYVWGAQVEAGAYATSYIPTLAASVTRVADVCNKTSASALIGQTEGTLFAELSFPNLTSGASSYFYFTDGTFNNSVIIGREPSGGSPKYMFYINASGSNVLFNSSIAIQSGFAKLALAYKSGSWAAYLNGTLVASGTNSLTFGTMNRIGLGTNDTVMTAQGDTMIAKQALLFKTRLTNAQLSELTT
jgi:hypothetical protein